MPIEYVNMLVIIMEGGSNLGGFQENPNLRVYPSNHCNIRTYYMSDGSVVVNSFVIRVLNYNSTIWIKRGWIFQGGGKCFIASRLRIIIPKVLLNSIEIIR